MLNTELTLKQLNTIMSDIKDNKIVVGCDLAIDKYDKKIWYEYDSKTFNYHLHTLKFIQYALEYYEKFNNDIGIEKSLAIFYLWFEENFPQSKSKVCYLGEVVTQRLLNVCDLLIVCMNNNLCILDDVFIKVISSHINYNLMDINYSQNRFNAIIQDISIIKAAIIYNRYYIDNAFNTEIDKAYIRLQKQIDYLIDKGQFIGNSLKASYQLFVHLYQFYLFLISYTDLEFVCYLKTKLDELYYFIYNITFPGGIYANSLVYLQPQTLINYPHELNKQFLALFTKDEKIKLITESIVYDRANLFIYNNDTRLNENYYKLIFMNNFSTTFEKKHDNLHFDLYFRDLLLFTSKNHKSNVLGRNFNNPIVDFHDYLIDKVQINLCSLTSFGKTNNFTFISGLHLLYEDVVIRRSLLLFYQRVIIIDEFSSIETHDFEINFNIHPSVSLEINNENIYSDLFRLKLLHSSNNYFINEDKNTVRINLKGKDEVLITMIDLSNSDEKINFDIKDKVIRINDISLIRNYYYHEIYYQNLNITKKLAPVKECLKALKQFYQLKNGLH